nr:disease resistance protein RPM1-like [Ziziphus jujuba var. spinosa]
MGGSGKTTLAKKVYDSVKQKFDCHAWVTVSQSYQKVELLKDIIKKFCEGNKEPAPEGINAMDEETLTNKLREYLLQKRYVVIFDDVWKVDFWGDIQHALHDNKNGGRIVITTRNMKVANFCRISSVVHVHRLEPLPHDKACQLFCKKVFKFDFEGCCPTYLAELSHKIVHKCEGLPLAIVAIAGLLSTKDKTIHEWQKLHDSLSSELESNPQLASIIKILSLSYSDLPYHLKSCFLCFGMYPEDYSIRCPRLIRQWIAEGFVNQKKDKTLEEVALEYLAELIHRSLVQVSTVDSQGRVRTCRIHDLLREVVVKKMESSFFCHVVDGNKSALKGEIVTRRLSIVNNSSTTVLQDADRNSQVRSILNFNKTLLNICIPRTLAKNFKLLKFLDFENAPIDSIYEDIGKLFHLRYLSLRNTKVKKLPKSIGKLVNLETLDLKQSFVSEIPAEIRRLHKLRHLLGYNRDFTMHFCLARTKGIKLKEGFGSLESLQKLYKLDAEEMGAEVIEELGKLKQLRRLGIRNLRSEYGRILGGCIEKMNHLESLEVGATSEDDMIDLESMSSPPQFLQRLRLKGRLMKLPEWIKKLQNLTMISFNWSKLEDDPLKTFKNLPNLLTLIINHDAYVGDELQFEKGMFPKLKELDLTYLSGLERVVIEEGSLVNIESLEIGPSPQLKEVPSGIQHLKNLQYLSFYDMSEEFIESMLPKGGQHYEIVQHVRLVLIRCTCDEGKYETSHLF